MIRNNNNIIYTVCGENQEWNDCGSACPAKCSDSVPSICTFQCIAGCFCKNGYKLDDDGNCIPENECPTNVPIPICGENEEWNNCGSGCPEKCSDSKPQICTEQCIAGCFCKNGYKLDDDGNCIPEDECPTTFESP